VPPCAGSLAPTGTASAAPVLAAADAHDGATDHVVHECTGCGLGMPGDAAHAVKHEGYELHFCSETCKANFEKDPAAGLARLEGAVKK
jgi:YHS domain-containing protein